MRDSDSLNAQILPLKNAQLFTEEDHFSFTLISLLRVAHRLNLSFISPVIDEIRMIISSIANRLSYERNFPFFFFCIMNILAIFSSSFCRFSDLNDWHAVWFDMFDHTSAFKPNDFNWLNIYKEKFNSKTKSHSMRHAAVADNAKTFSWLFFFFFSWLHRNFRYVVDWSDDERFAMRKKISEIYFCADTMIEVTAYRTNFSMPTN